MYVCVEGGAEETPLALEQQQLVQGGEVSEQRREKEGKREGNMR